jgi:effector-binding domain-containing protein
MAPGFGNENINPVMQALVPEVLGHLERAEALPGIMIAWYEEPADDGSVIVHAGFDVADQSVPDGERVHVVNLESIRAAAVLHRGPMENIASVYEAFVRWIEDSGNQLAGRSRELYHEWDHEHPEHNVTELQMPIES